MEMMMPTYEYLCPICNLKEEYQFTVYSNHTVFCKTCKVEMDKQFAPTPTHFKAKGFYKTGD
jgi:predicted nucleic acid-binding Zn ribbon protein